MERGSVVDAQIELFAEQKKEYERVKDPVYFYRNYWTSEATRILLRPTPLKAWADTGRLMKILAEGFKIPVEG